jgi:HK97 family phage major capsid protein
VPASLIDQLRERRQEAREAADLILTRAADDSRDLTSDEVAEHSQHVRDEREANDALEREHARELSDVRASVARGAGPPVLTREAAETARAFQSAIFSRNPSPIEVACSFDQDDGWPEGFEEPIRGRTGKMRVHYRSRQESPNLRYAPIQERAVLTTTPTQALGTDVYSSIVEHLVETSAVMNAGATVVTTETGETLVVPRSEQFVVSAFVGEGVPITASSPVFGTVPLGAYKYGSYFELGYELANDTPTNLLDYVARAAAQSLALGPGGYGTDLINGTGTSEPRGLLTDAAVGKTGPGGTGTSLGAQSTAGQGTDCLWDLVGSLAEPYAQAARAAFIMRNASDIVVRKLKDSTGQPVQGLTTRGQILGYPSFLDPFVPPMANGNESIAFGDMSRYFVRIVNGVRFERSDEYKFKDDVVAFRCLIRLDAALIDTNAVKTFVNTT